MCENGSNPSFDRQKLINLPFLNVASVCLEDRERERERKTSPNPLQTCAMKSKICSIR